ncbi:hypothetical protein JCM1841_000811, partial [Sporobolomyces salmonicolor]
MPPHHVPANTNKQSMFIEARRIEDEKLQGEIAKLRISSVIFKVPLDFVAAAPENSRSLEHAQARGNLSHVCTLNAGIDNLASKFSNPFLPTLEEMDLALRDRHMETLKKEEGKPGFTPVLFPIHAYLAFDTGASPASANKRRDALLDWVKDKAKDSPPNSLVEIDDVTIGDFAVHLPAAPAANDDEEEHEERQIFARILAGQGRIEVTRRFWEAAGRPESKPPYAYVELYDPAIIKNHLALQHLVQSSNGEPLGRSMTAIEFFETIYAHDHLPADQRPATPEDEKALAAANAAALRRAHPSDGRIQPLTKLAPLPKMRVLLRELFTASPVATSMFVRNVHLIGRMLGGGGALKVAASYITACEFYASKFEGHMSRAELLVSPDANGRTSFVIPELLQKVQRLLATRIPATTDRQAYSVSRRLDLWPNKVAINALGDPLNSKVKGKTKLNAVDAHLSDDRRLKFLSTLASLKPFHANGEVHRTVCCEPAVDPSTLSLDKQRTNSQLERHLRWGYQVDAVDNDWREFKNSKDKPVPLDMPALKLWWA